MAKLNNSILTHGVSFPYGNRRLGIARIRHERGYSRPASPTRIIWGRSADGGFASWCAAFTWASGGGGSCRFCRGVCASDGLGRPPSDRTPRAFAGARDPDRHWSGCGALSQGARPRRRRDGAAGSLHLTGSCLPISGAPSRSRNLLPWLYLKGISTGDFCEALAALLGPEAPGLSASTIARLKEVWQGELEHWQRRDLSAKRYVYFWADGVYFSPRLDHDKQCMCVIIGADELGPQGAAGDRRRLPGERPVLARSAARSQAPRPGDCARAGHRRWGARFLESLARGLRDDARAALLGAQDRQRAQQAPEVRPATRQAAPTGHLDGRDPRGGREGLRLLPRGLWPQVRQSGGLPGQGPRRVARLLRLPGRALEAHSHHQSHRKHLCDRAPQDHQDQGAASAA